MAFTKKDLRSIVEVWSGAHDLGTNVARRLGLKIAQQLLDTMERKDKADDQHGRAGCDGVPGGGAPDRGVRPGGVARARGRKPGEPFTLVGPVRDADALMDALEGTIGGGR